MTVIQLDLSDQAAQLLWSNAMHDFRVEQPGRFLPLDGGHPDPEVIDGTLHWFGTAADALLFRAYEKACGFRAFLFSDEGAGSDDPYVVLTSRPFPTGGVEL